jgi:hypothetical protein
MVSELNANGRRDRRTDHRDRASRDGDGPQNDDASTNDGLGGDRLPSDSDAAATRFFLRRHNRLPGEGSRPIERLQDLHQKTRP